MNLHIYLALLWAEHVLFLDDQLRLFKGYINKLNATLGENATSTIISQSFYIVCAGNNDIINTYFGLPFARIKYNISIYTGLIMVNWASSFVRIFMDYLKPHLGQLFYIWFWHFERPICFQNPLLIRFIQFQNTKYSPSKEKIQNISLFL